VRRECHIIQARAALLHFSVCLMSWSSGTTSVTDGHLQYSPSVAAQHQAAAVRQSATDASLSQQAATLKRSAMALMGPAVALRQNAPQMRQAAALHKMRQNAAQMRQAAVQEQRALAPMNEAGAVQCLPVQHSMKSFPGCSIASLAEQQANTAHRYLVGHGGCGIFRLSISA
jgi:hypothetical protein